MQSTVNVYIYNLYYYIILLYIDKVKYSFLYIQLLVDECETIMELYDNNDDIKLMFLYTNHRTCLSSIHNNIKLSKYIFILNSLSINHPVSSNIIYISPAVEHFNFVIMKYILLNKYINNSIIITDNNNNNNSFSLDSSFNLLHLSEYSAPVYIYNNNNNVNVILQKSKMKKCLVILHLSSLSLIMNITNSYTDYQFIIANSYDFYNSYNEILNNNNNNVLFLSSVFLSSTESIKFSSINSMLILQSLNIYMSIRKLNYYSYTISRYSSNLFDGYRGNNDDINEMIRYDNYIESPIFICSNITECNKMNYYKSNNFYNINNNSNKQIKNKQIKSNSNVYYIGGLFALSGSSMDRDEAPIVFVFLQLVDNLNRELSVRGKQFLPLYFDTQNNNNKFYDYINTLSNQSNVIAIFGGTKPSQKENIVKYLIESKEKVDIMYIYLGTAQDMMCNVNILCIGPSQLLLSYLIYKDVLSHSNQFIGVIIDSSDQANDYLGYLKLYTQLIGINVLQYENEENKRLEAFMNRCLDNTPCIIILSLSEKMSKQFYDYCYNNNIVFSYHGDVTVYDLVMTENSFSVFEPNRIIGVITVSSYFRDLLKYQYSAKNEEFLDFVYSNEHIPSSYSPIWLTESLYIGFLLWKSAIVDTDRYDCVNITNYLYKKEFNTPSGITVHGVTNALIRNIYLAQAIYDEESTETSKYHFKIITSNTNKLSLQYFPYFNLITSSYCSIDRNGEITTENTNNLIIAVLSDRSTKHYNDLSNLMIEYIENIFTEMVEYGFLFTPSLYPIYLINDETDDRILSSLFLNQNISIVIGAPSYYSYNKVLPYIMKSDKICITIYQPQQTLCVENIFYLLQPEINLIYNMFEYYNSLYLTTIYYIYINDDYYNNERINNNLINIYRNAIKNDFKNNIKFEPILADETNTLAVIFQKYFSSENERCGIIIALRDNYLVEYIKQLQITPLNRLFYIQYIIYYDPILLTDYQQQLNDILVTLPSLDNTKVERIIENKIVLMIDYIKYGLIEAIKYIKMDTGQDFVNVYSSSIDRNSIRLFIIRAFENVVINKDNKIIKGSTTHVVDTNYFISNMQKGLLIIYEKQLNIHSLTDKVCNISKNVVKFSYTTGFLVFFIVVHVVDVLFFGSFIFFIYYFRKTAIMRSSSPLLMAYIAFALYNFSLSCYVFCFVRYNDMSCSFSMTYWVTSCQNLISALVFKTWRIDKLLNNKKLKKFSISNRVILTKIFSTLFFHVAIDIVWYPIHSYSSYKEIVLLDESNNLQTVIYGTCENLTVYIVIHYIPLALTYIYAWIESWKTTDVEEQFNESRTLATCVLCMFYTSIFYLTLQQYVRNDPVAYAILLPIVLSFACLVNGVLLWFPKFFYLYTINWSRNNTSSNINNNNNNVLSSSRKSSNESYAVNIKSMSRIPSRKSSVCRVIPEEGIVFAGNIRNLSLCNRKMIPVYEPPSSDPSKKPPSFVQNYSPSCINVNTKNSTDK